MKKIYSFIFAFCLCNMSHAGFNGLTHHSRANCVNNETISWDLTSAWTTLIISTHSHPINSHETHIHSRGTDWQHTWRNAIVHWGEGNGGWTVTGEHYMIDAAGKAYLAQQETVTDCRIYDGWWVINN